MNIRLFSTDVYTSVEILNIQNQMSEREGSRA